MQNLDGQFEEYVMGFERYDKVAESMGFTHYESAGLYSLWWEFLNNEVGGIMSEELAA